MTGINKRSNDPKLGQSKIKINPWYNTSAILKGALDEVTKAMNPKKKK